MMIVQSTPTGANVKVVGVDCTIIMNPKTWVASGHVGGFNDPMVDCKESKSRYRADHLVCLGVKGETGERIFVCIEGDDDSTAKARKKLDKYVKRTVADEEIDTCPFADLSAEERL